MREIMDKMNTRNLVIGQKISPELKARAKYLRQYLTPEEKILWEKRRGNRLAGFHIRRQQIINGYIVDFYCHSRGLVIEIDGDIHRK